MRVLWGLVAVRGEALKSRIGEGRLGRPSPIDGTRLGYFFLAAGFLVVLAAALLAVFAAGFFADFAGAFLVAFAAVPAFFVAAIGFLLFSSVRRTVGLLRDITHVLAQ